ncbi:MAG TPA: hypothetical protein VI729_03490, partial [Anaerolineales bacterium]|nr:hypothetical protein [Anaerolineales bacterium]
GNTWTEKPNAAEGISTGDTFTLTSADDIYIGAPFRFDTIKVDMGSPVNANAATIAVAVVDKDGPLAATLGTDGTASAGATLAQDGSITLTPPGSWVPRTLQGSELYWARLRPSANLTAAIELKVTVSPEKHPDDNYQTLLDTGSPDYTQIQTVRWTTTGQLLVCGSQPYNGITVTLGTTVNAVASTLAGYYWDGHQWQNQSGAADGTASAGATFAQSGDITFTTSYDWKSRTINGTTGYWTLFTVSAALTNDVQVSRFKLQRSNYLSEDLPALVANQEAWVTLSIDPTQFPYPDETAVKSFGLKLATDLGAQNIEIRGGVHLIGGGSRSAGDVTWYEFPIESKIINIEAYASSQTEELKNPWVFTENRPFEIQQQNDNQIVEMPLSEIAAFRSYENGLATCVNGPYLYFTLGKRIQRYYNRTLEDVSPDRAQANLPAFKAGIAPPPGQRGPTIIQTGGGLRESLLGQPVKLLSYPGKVLV